MSNKYLKVITNDNPLSLSIVEKMKTDLEGLFNQCILNQSFLQTLSKKEVSNKKGILEKDILKSLSNKNCNIQKDRSFTTISKLSVANNKNAIENISKTEERISTQSKPYKRPTEKVIKRNNDISSINVKTSVYNNHQSNSDIQSKTIKINKIPIYSSNSKDLDHKSLIKNVQPIKITKIPEKIQNSSIFNLSFDINSSQLSEKNNQIIKISKYKRKTNKNSVTFNDSDDQSSKSKSDKSSKMTRNSNKTEQKLVIPCSETIITEELKVRVQNFINLVNEKKPIEFFNFSLLNEKVIKKKEEIKLKKLQQIEKDKLLNEEIAKQKSIDEKKQMLVNNRLMNINNFKGKENLLKNKIVMKSPSILKYSENMKYPEKLLNDQQINQINNKRKYSISSTNNTDFSFQCLPNKKSKMA